MRKISIANPILLLSCGIVGISLAGCVLDDLIYAGPCPPEGTNAELAYIAYVTTQENTGSQTDDKKLTRCERGQDCYTDAFLSNNCPIDYPFCHLDSSKQYYCISRCPDGQIACEGKCINPQKDRDFCGAEKSCSNKEYGCCTGWTQCDDWQDCKKGKCVNKPQEEGQLRCKDGALELYTDGKWQMQMLCPNNICDE
ncbi:MAG: hypothetical protein J6A01_07550, partial [Proteobacteria bacterium]|nr:hypothetical protein [Pseudomonadota bacterium]